MTTKDPPAYLTVPELAELLRVKERKVYDLAASGEVPCSRATGKLLFPRGDVEAWLFSNRSGPSLHRPNVFLGSHDPLLEWALRQSESGLATFFQSSRDGLDRFAAAEGVATGLHLQAPDGSWNLTAAREAAGGQDAVLLSWAGRARGLAIRISDAGAIRGPRDLAGRRLARRQDGAGSQEAILRVLADQGVDPTDIEMAKPSLSEQDAVMAVASGEADAAFGLQAMASAFGLAFVPLMNERFDILVSRRHWFEPPLQTLLQFTASDEFRQHAARLGGYDIDRLGEVLWNA